MNKNVKEFIKRGLMFCWGGPVILAIVWLCINNSGIANNICLHDASVSIISTMILAFVVAGISMIYQIEKLPIVTAGLIHFAVIYVAYLAVYLLNNWFDKSIILIFTIIFVLVFIVIWLVVYFVINKKVNKLNKCINDD